MAEYTEKKILYLMEYPIDLPGGGQMSTQTLCEGLCALNEETIKGNTEYKYLFKPVVCCPTLLSKKESDYPFEIVTYPSDENRELSKVRRLSNFFSRIGHFKRIIKEVWPDLIHVSMSESLVTFGFLRVPGMFKNIPFVYTDRGLRYGYRIHSKICILTTMKRAARMLTTTEFNKALWKETSLKCPITVIPNTISGAFDEYDGNKRVSMKKAAGLTRDDFVIGFAGRISEEKDWPCVKKLIAALNEEEFDYKVALVLSTYEDRDKEIAREIKESITSQIGEDRLIYMENLSQKEISDYYYMVDVFVMTSSFESFGKAAVEAMSRKCGVLSTTAGGLREVIGREKDLYDKSNLSVFAKRMKELFDDPDSLDVEREYFYSRYKTLYTKEVNVTRHADVYEEIIAREA